MQLNAYIQSPTYGNYRKNIMVQKNLVKRPPLSAWQSELFRFTAFPVPNADFDAHGWWSDVVGELPETESSHPKVKTIIEEGPYLKGKLQLSTQPGRIDWLHGMDIELLAERGEVPTLGSFPETLSDFQELVVQWLNKVTCPNAVRIAFGATLLNPVDSHEDGYHILSTYLPYVELDAENSFDFLYQINRRRDSKIGIQDLRINRLSKWSVALLTYEPITISPSAVSRFGAIRQYACRLELDINTSPSFEGEFTLEDIRNVFDELVKLGTETAEEGDKK